MSLHGVHLLCLQAWAGSWRPRVWSGRGTGASSTPCPQPGTCFLRATARYTLPVACTAYADPWPHTSALHPPLSLLLLCRPIGAGKAVRHRWVGRAQNVGRLQDTCQGQRTSPPASPVSLCPDMRQLIGWTMSAAPHWHPKAGNNSSHLLCRLHPGSCQSCKPAAWQHHGQR